MSDKALIELLSGARGLVRGYVWKARFSNGAVFEWWTPIDVPRKTAIKELFDIAGGDSYSKEDLDNVWKTKGAR